MGPGQGVHHRIPRARIDEQGMAAVLHEDRVTLADIEHDDARRSQPPPRGEHDGDKPHACDQRAPQPAAPDIGPPEVADRQRHRASAGQSGAQRRGWRRGQRQARQRAEEVQCRPEHELSGRDERAAGDWQPAQHARQRAEPKCRRHGRPGDKVCDRGDERDPPEGGRHEGHGGELADHRRREPRHNGVGHPQQEDPQLRDYVARRTQAVAHPSHEEGRIGLPDAQRDDGHDREQEGQLPGDRWVEQAHHTSHSGHGRERMGPSARKLRPAGGKRHEPRANGRYGCPAEDDKSARAGNKQRDAWSRTQTDRRERGGHERGNRGEVRAGYGHEVGRAAPREEVGDSPLVKGLPAATDASGKYGPRVARLRIDCGDDMRAKREQGPPQPTRTLPRRHPHDPHAAAEPLAPARDAIAVMREWGKPPHAPDAQPLLQRLLAGQPHGTAHATSNQGRARAVPVAADARVRLDANGPS